jgi:hypothetical protein
MQTPTDFLLASTPILLNSLSLGHPGNPSFQTVAHQSDLIKQFLVVVYPLAVALEAGTSFKLHTRQTTKSCYQKHEYGKD